MLPLLVRITNTTTGETEHSAFASSPVRIGRNQLNELVLNEPFVSQWHAVVRFDEHKVRYVDLGSTNGTTLAGARLARHVQVEVDPQSDLRIGPLQLSFARAQVTPDMYAAPRTTIFTLGPQSSDGEGSAVTNATMMFNPSDPATLEQNTMMFMPGMTPGQSPPQGGPPTQQSPQQNVGVDMQQLIRIVDGTKPYYEQYRQAWGTVLKKLEGELSQLPQQQREGIVLCLCQQLPQLPKEPEFRELMEKMDVNAAALGQVDPAQWVARLGGQDSLPPGAQINTAVAMERVGVLLESFSQAFVELRKGYEQFGEEMALQLVQDRNPLHDADSAQDVMTYLLDWQTDGGERVRELTRAFADLALHQVALLSGVMEGVRGMLQGMSPQQLTGVRNAALAKQGGGGLLESIFNSKKAAAWKSFVDQHQKLIEEDRFSREVFGRNFARAYFMVTGGHMQGHEFGSDGGPAPGQPPQHGPPPTSPYNN